MITDVKQVIAIAEARGFKVLMKPGPPPMPFLRPTPGALQEDASPALIEALKAWRVEIIEELGGRPEATIQETYQAWEQSKPAPPDLELAEIGPCPGECPVRAPFIVPKPRPADPVPFGEKERERMADCKGCPQMEIELLFPGEVIAQRWCKDGFDEGAVAWRMKGDTEWQTIAERPLPDFGPDEVKP